jgi:hypothetical protein
MKLATCFVLCIGIVASPVHGFGLLAGNALRFDGVNDFAMIPDSTSLQLERTFTVEFWLYQASYGQPASGEWLLTKTGLAGCDTFVIADTVSTDIGASFRTAPASSAATTVWGPSPLAQWFHMAFTADTANSQARLFIDGTLVSETHTMEDGSPIPNLPVCSNTAPILIGGLPPFPNNYLDGMIDEVRVWNVARSSSEIAQDYNRLVNPTTPGLVGYWNFDESIGDQHIYDSSPFGNNGNLGGALAAGSDDPTRVPSTAPLVPEPDMVMLLVLAAGFARRIPRHVWRGV